MTAVGGELLGFIWTDGWRRTFLRFHSRGTPMMVSHEGAKEGS